MLESLENSNLKRMSIESPEKRGVSFDPEKEMSEETIERIRDFVIQAFEDKRWIHAMDALYYGKQLGFDPQLRVHLNVPIDQLKRGLDIGNANSAAQIRAYHEAVVLEPLTNLTYNEEFEGKLNELQNVMRGRGNYEQLAFLTEISSEAYGTTIEENLADQEVAAIIDATRSRIKSGFGNEAVHLGYILKEAGVDLNNKDIRFNTNELREELQHLKLTEEWSSYVQMLYYINRLGLTASQDLIEQENSQSMPEQKNF